MSLDLEREQTVQLLCRQFALDHLTTQDLESRLEQAYRAKTSEELQALVAGMPAALPAPREAWDGASALAPMESGARHVLSIFGSVRKRGDWEPAQEMTARAWFGDLELDFRSALIHEGVTTIHVDATFAHVKIVVPPGLHVECDGAAIFGEFTEKTSLSAPPGSGAPTLRITGRAVFGQVEIKMRMPEETAMQTLKRELKQG